MPPRVAVRKGQEPEVVDESELGCTVRALVDSSKWMHVISPTEPSGNVRVTVCLSCVYTVDYVLIRVYRYVICALLA